MIDFEFHILKGTSDKPNYSKLKKKKIFFGGIWAFFFFFSVGREYLKKCHKKR